MSHHNFIIAQIPRNLSLSPLCLLSLSKSAWFFLLPLLEVLRAIQLGYHLDPAIPLHTFDSTGDISGQRFQWRPRKLRTPQTLFQSRMREIVQRRIPSPSTTREARTRPYSDNSARSRKPCPPFKKINNLSWRLFWPSKKVFSLSRAR